MKIHSAEEIEEIYNALGVADKAVLKIYVVYCEISTGCTSTSILMLSLQTT